MSDLDRVIAALQAVKPSRIGDELHHLHPLIEDALHAGAIRFTREKSIGPRSRADFFTSEGTLIEVKRMRPARHLIVQQLDRYAACEGVTAIILVLERSIDLPTVVNGIPVRIVSLNSNWGVAV